MFENKVGNSEIFIKNLCFFDYTDDLQNFFRNFCLHIKKIELCCISVLYQESPDGVSMTRRVCKYPHAGVGRSS